MAYTSASAYWTARRDRDAARKQAQTQTRTSPNYPTRCSKCGGPVTATGGYCIAPITGPGSCERAYTD